MAKSPQKLVKPKTVLKKWEDYQAEQKEKKKRVSSRVAKTMAKLAGMKSMGEVRCAADMDDRKVKWAYEDTILPYTIEANYNPDFTVVGKTEDGIPVYIEYKGKMTQSVRSKMAAVRRCHPDKRICLVFERSENKCSKAPNSQRYWRWAELNGYPWSDQTVNDEWFTERFWKEYEKSAK